MKGYGKNCRPPGYHLATGPLLLQALRKVTTCSGVQARGAGSAGFEDLMPLAASGSAVTRVEIVESRLLSTFFTTAFSSQLELLSQASIWEAQMDFEHPGHLTTDHPGVVTSYIVCYGKYLPAVDLEKHKMKMCCPQSSFPTRFKSTSAKNS